MPEASELLDEVRASDDVSVRTGKAADLYRHANAEAAKGRTRRDAALFTLVRFQRMRPAEVERQTGVPPSMTNYAVTRARAEDPAEVEQPIETIAAAVAEIDQWEQAAEDARTIRDDGIRALVKSGQWSARDLPRLVGLTPSRISQIVGGVATAGQPRAPHASLRFATLPQVAAELDRRGALLAVEDGEGSKTLYNVADTVRRVAERQP